MFNVDIDDTVIIEQRRALEAALSTNPRTEAALRRAIRKAVLDARRAAVASIHFKNGDPRQSRQSVRTAVYKKVLGANINIYSSRRLHGGGSWRPARKLDGNPRQRGGNRVPRSARTEQVMGYGPLDRGFILRFQNSGTVPRTSRYGNRGSLAAMRFFRPLGERALAVAADRLAALIDTELDDMLGKGK